MAVYTQLDRLQDFFEVPLYSYSFDQIEVVVSEFSHFLFAFVPWLLLTCFGAQRLLIAARHTQGACHESVRL